MTQLNNYFFILTINIMDTIEEKTEQSEIKQKIPRVKKVKAEPE
jgi:hypothetical protein